ncbi:MAG: PIG-L family deacetylase [Dehalococcoidia bacterium]
MNEIEKGHDRLRVLGVFAHPDDETFCAGGTLAKYAAAGAETMVVSFTRGDAGQIRDTHAATRHTLGKVREQELYQACKHLGVQHAACLDYGDGNLKDVDWRTLLGHVVQTIRTFRPDVVLTFGHDGAYGHPDHMAISVATTEAYKLAGDAEQFPEQIASGLLSHTPSELYQCHFPRNRLLLMDHLVQWLKNLDTRFRGTLDFIQGLKLFSSASTTLGYNSDHIEVEWYPRGFHIIEQREPATSLYLILSGHAEVVQEDSDGVMRKLGQRGPGEFVGEVELAYGRPRDANVITLEGVTCLVFSPGEPPAFVGRGAEAQFATAEGDADTEDTRARAYACVDVSDYVQQKIAAVAAHRTQYRISEDILPLAILREMLGRECFVGVHAPNQDEYPPFEMAEFRPAGNKALPQRRVA